MKNQTGQAQTIQALEEMVRAIHAAHSELLWMDFVVFKYEYQKGRLIICGSEDSCYYHQLEIIFEETYFFHGPTSWESSPHENGMLKAIGENDPIRKKYQLGRQAPALQFINDDNLDIVVSAASIGFNQDTVYYYQRENLQAWERLADWVVP